MRLDLLRVQVNSGEPLSVEMVPGSAGEIRFGSSAREMR
jgi:hypothetical protein